MDDVNDQKKALSVGRRASVISSLNLRDTTALPLNKKQAAKEAGREQNAKHSKLLYQYSIMRQSFSPRKHHARGPMALEALTSYKCVVRGEGQIRKP